MNEIERGIYARNLARNKKGMRYYVRVKKRGKTHTVPGHVTTLEEARIRRDTLLDTLHLEEPEPEKLDGAASILDAGEAEKLLDVLALAIGSGDVTALGAVASPLLVALQRSRQSVGDTLTLDTVLHPPPCWGGFDRHLCVLFLRAFKQQLTTRNKKGNE